MRVELDVPIKPHQVEAARHALEHKADVEFKNKHGKVEKAKVLKVEYRMMPQGVGNGYFVDLMFEGDDVTVSEYLANKIADAKAGQ